MWLAVSYMLIGKAHQLDEGEWDDGGNDAYIDRMWAIECRKIANTIISLFRRDGPGGHKLQKFSAFKKASR